MADLPVAPNSSLRTIADFVREWEPFRTRQLDVCGRGCPGVTERIDREQFVALHRISAIVLACPELVDGRILWCDGVAYEWDPADAFREWHWLETFSFWRSCLLLPEW